MPELTQLARGRAKVRCWAMHARDCVQSPRHLQLTSLGTLGINQFIRQECMELCRNKDPVLDSVKRASCFFPRGYFLTIFLTAPYTLMCDACRSPGSRNVILRMVTLF